MPASRWTRPIVLVLATMAVVEWLHFRLGEQTLFELWNPTSGTEISIDDDFQSVTEHEFETYVAVLEAMQTNHALEIDAAVAAAQLELPEFREIERRVQRDDFLVERAREALREKAEHLWEKRFGEG